MNARTYFNRDCTRLAPIPQRTTDDRNQDFCFRLLYTIVYHACMHDSQVISWLEPWRLGTRARWAYSLANTYRQQNTYKRTPAPARSPRYTLTQAYPQNETTTRSRWRFAQTKPCVSILSWWWHEDNSPHSFSASNNQYCAWAIKTFQLFKQQRPAKLKLMSYAQIHTHTPSQTSKRTEHNCLSEREMHMHYLCVESAASEIKPTSCAEQN